MRQEQVKLTKYVSIPHRFDSHYITRKQIRKQKGVSIPHRYDSHDGNSFRNLVHFNVSIPHRYDSHADWEADFYYEDKFQSLTGTIHTRNCLKNAMEECLSFNPSQVRFTRRQRQKVQEQQKRFNPSQVRFTR